MARVEIFIDPYCPYCVRAKRLLDERAITYEETDVTADPALRADIMARSGRRTVPQIFINGRSIGGYDDLAALDAAGELEGLLAE